MTKLSKIVCFLLTENIYRVVRLYNVNFPFFTLPKIKETIQVLLKHLLNFGRAEKKVLSASEPKYIFQSAVLKDFLNIVILNYRVFCDFLAKSSDNFRGQIFENVLKVCHNCVLKRQKPLILGRFCLIK
jgi:hypothetical protein